MMNGRRTVVRRALRWGILLAAVGFLVWGIQRGEAAVVLRKAINICFECIGLG